MSLMHKTLGALLGATVALTPGVLGACWTVFGPLSLNPDGIPDNPPMRGAGLFLLASPFLFGILFMFYALSIQLLHWAARLSRNSLCSTSLAAAAALWVWLVVREGGLSTDGAVPVTILSAVVGALMLAGALVSWLALRPGPNKPLQPTRAAPPNEQREPSENGPRG
jgi:hypothetical protein